MAFQIELLNGAGTIIGAGPLINVLRATWGEALDRAAECTFEVPATDQRTIDTLPSAVYARLTADDGYTRTALIATRKTRAVSPPVIVVSGYDLLAELGLITCGWMADYKTSVGGGVYGDDVNTDVLPDLIDNTGWSAGTIDASLGLYLGSFNGLSRLAALDKLRARLGVHYRQPATERSLDFGAFGDDSGYRLINVERVLRAQDANSAIGLIESLEIVEDGGDVINLIVPFGAGQDGSYLISGGMELGKVKLLDLIGTGIPEYATTDIHVRAGIRGGGATTTTTAGSSGTTVTVASTTGMVAGRKFYIGDADNAEDNDVLPLSRTIASITDGTHFEMSSAATVANGRDVIVDPQFYLVDATAYAAQPREATIIFAEVDVPFRTPAGVNSAQFSSAAKELYNRAKAYLTEHAAAHQVYRVTPSRVPSTLRPGMTVRVVYHGRVTRDGVAAEWLDIDTDLYVINIARTYSGDGTPSIALDVSDINRQRRADAEMVAQLVNGQGALDVRI